MKKHNCDAPEDIKTQPNGIAIDNCFEQDNELWVSNEEYTNTVKYCPFCGFSLQTQQKITMKQTKKERVDYYEEKHIKKHAMKKGLAGWLRSATQKQYTEDLKAKNNKIV